MMMIQTDKVPAMHTTEIMEKLVALPAGKKKKKGKENSYSDLYWAVLVYLVQTLLAAVMHAASRHV